MKHRVTREQWAKRIEKWKESGLTMSLFAREAGINATSLKWWKWRLEAEANIATGTPPESGPPISKYRRQPATKSDEKGITFVELPRLAPAKSPIEIVLASGVRVCVQANFEAATLERVLAVLGARK